jgi:hypothetical protein
MAVPKKQRTAAHPSQLARKLRLAQGSGQRCGVQRALEMQREQPRAHTAVWRVSASFFYAQGAPTASLSAATDAGSRQAYAGSNQAAAARSSVPSRLGSAYWAWVRAYVGGGAGIKSLGARGVFLSPLI